MINRLVEYVLRTNPVVRDALRATYPFVFLDEFQDTTAAQYDIVVSAFDPATTRITTVGDDKQRIMGWAGAMPNGFEVFTQRFGARRVSLLSNWRSHEDLVAVQRRVAARIDATTEDMVARRARGGERRSLRDLRLPRPGKRGARAHRVDVEPSPSERPGAASDCHPGQEPARPGSRRSCAQPFPQVFPCATWRARWAALQSRIPWPSS